MASQRASQASTTPEETRRTTVCRRAASGLLQDAGNCRQSIHQVLNLLPLSDSLVSEQQKLRVALDWAQSFLSGGSDVYHKDNDAIWPGNRETGDLKSVAATSGEKLDGSSDHAGKLDAASCWSNARKYNALQKNDSTKTINGGAQSKAQRSDNQKERRKQSEDGKMESHDGKMCKTSSSASAVHTNDRLSCSSPVKIIHQTAKPPKPTSTSHLTIPSNLTVYEQYKFCVDQLHHLRRTNSREKGKKSPEDVATPAGARAPPASSLECNFNSTNPEMNKHPNEVQAITEKRAPSTPPKNRNTETPPTNQEEFKPREGLNVNEAPAAVRAESRSLCRDNNRTGVAHLDRTGNNYALNTNSAEADERISSEMERSAALTADPGLKDHKMRTEGRGQRGLSQNLNRTDGGSGGMLPRQQMRPQSAGASKYTRGLNAQTHTKRHTLEARAKHTAPCRGTHTCLQPAKTHTRHPQPAGVAVRGWLRLPDEVWLSVLSLLPLGDLCRAAQVCGRLHTLATDHTLWRRLRIEDSTLTERWLLSVGRRRPRSLRLHSCSSRSVAASGLEAFFVLCRQTVQEVSVTGCMGPGLHGDHVLTLVGRLCDRVTSVDVSWSGATDGGVTALSGGRAGLTLTSVVLNGCHVTDEPLKKLVMRHKQSLCRLEVFGCQFLTATCLQTVYEMCPGLKHLNIGQLPKVTKLSLTVMTSHLKSLLSLNLTGLKAVTDAMLDALLQNCVALQSLTLSSCPGVTDVTLHNVSKYTPCIRSIDVSSCKAITDAGVQSLTLGCKRLQQLDLSSTGTGSRGVSLLASYCSRHLQTVKLSFCHIGLDDILELCRRCSRLRVLHLYGCPHLPTERDVRDVNSDVKVSPLS